MELAEKKCSKCSCVKPLTQFYRRTRNGREGRQSQCKACRLLMKQQVTARMTTEQVEQLAASRHRYYAANTDKWRDYYRGRYRRVTAARRITSRRWKKANHSTVQVHKRVAWAVKSGRLIPAKFCSECGSTGRIHGHHDDYTKPLEVRWLCPLCHVAWHRENEAITGVSLQ